MVSCVESNVGDPVPSNPMFLSLMGPDPDPIVSGTEPDPSVS